MWNEKESLPSPSLFKLSDKNSSVLSLPHSLSFFLFPSVPHVLLQVMAVFLALFFLKEDDDFFADRLRLMDFSGIHKYFKTSEKTLMQPFNELF